MVLRTAQPAVQTLLAQKSRHFNNGCVRLEDAGRLSEWLLRKPLVANPKRPEELVPLDLPVPVYQTYLTTSAGEKGIAIAKDVYGRDGMALARN